MPGSSTKTSNSYKDLLWLVCNSPAQLTGSYGPSAPWQHVKIACNVWTDTLNTPINQEIHASSQRQMSSGLLYLLLAAGHTHATAGHMRAGKGSIRHTMALSPLLLEPSPPGTAHCSEKSLSTASHSRHCMLSSTWPRQCS